eukprot:scaffold9342_cov126-Isochrysis_galbana.AAC.1
MSISSYASDLSAASHSHSCEFTQSNPLKLAEYNFEVEHKPGANHCDADAISRLVAAILTSPGAASRNEDMYAWQVATVRTATTTARRLQAKNRASRRYRAVCLNLEGRLALRHEGWAVVLPQQDRESTDSADLRLYIPESLRHSYMVAFHDSAGHLGVERMCRLLRARVYWPKLSQDVADYVRECHECTLGKPPMRTLAQPSGPQVGAYPFDI